MNMIVLLYIFTQQDWCWYSMTKTSTYIPKLFKSGMQDAGWTHVIWACLCFHLDLICFSVKHWQLFIYKSTLVYEDLKEEGFWVLCYSRFQWGDITLYQVRILTNSLKGQYKTRKRRKQNDSQGYMNPCYYSSVNECREWFS